MGRTLKGALLFVMPFASPPFSSSWWDCQTNNIVRWIRAGLEIHNQEKLIERYSAEIKDMDRQIHGLTHSKDSLERFARENFGFAEPGDDVYIIEK